MKKIFSIWVGVVLSVAGCSRPAAPDAATMTIVNRSGFDVMEIILAPAGTGQWQRNILPSDALAFGQALEIPLPREVAQVSVWDVKAVDADGRETIWTGAVLRASARLILNMDNRTPVVNLE